jgi:outer membrane protein OmpA-like peptidoglycan-associated protein
MKKLGKLIFVFTVLFYANSILAQDKNNQWQISVGLNAVDFVNEGENVIANKRANVDSWNQNGLSFNTISLLRYSDESFNYGFKGSFNPISTMGDGSGQAVDQMLTSLDVFTEYNLGKNFSFSNIEPYLEGGTGFTWLGTQKSLTLNGGAGIKIPFDDKISLKINTSYKHSFNDMQVLQPYFQHTVALAINFGGVDTDRDGIYDQYDDCPDEPGLPAFNGCPDNDGDGVADNVDSCKDVAGPVANSGCPWPDTDGDTILDKDDKCPNTPGLITNNGCPQPTKEIMEELNAVGAKVPFSLNAANLSEKVTRLLGIVQKIMEKYPTTSFTIEGHTDTTGPKTFNQKLSENRANAVLNFLVTNGVSSERLSAVGFGEDKPLNPNNTRKGRESNRRVEFKVVE